MKCKTCRGRGYLEVEFKNAPGEKPEKFKEECESCNGSGKVNPKRRREKDEFDLYQDYQDY